MNVETFTGRPHQSPMFCAPGTGEKQFRLAWPHPLLTTPWSGCFAARRLTHYYACVSGYTISRMRSRLQRVFYLRATAAGICLLAYLVAMGLAPMLLGLAAAIEGTHTVSLSCMPDRLVVVLHHRTATGGMEYEHRHGSTSKLVCLLGASHSSQGDHVASFATNLTCEITAGELGLKAPDLSSLIPFDSVPTPISPHPASFWTPESIPATSTACVPALRTTILLI